MTRSIMAVSDRELVTSRLEQRIIGADPQACSVPCWDAPLASDYNEPTPLGNPQRTHRAGETYHFLVILEIVVTAAQLSLSSKVKMTQ